MKKRPTEEQNTALDTALDSLQDSTQPLLQPTAEKHADKMQELASIYRQQGALDRPQPLIFALPNQLGQSTWSKQSAESASTAELEQKRALFFLHNAGDTPVTPEQMGLLEKLIDVRLQQSAAADKSSSGLPVSGILHQLLEEHRAALQQQLEDTQRKIEKAKTAEKQRKAEEQELLLQQQLQTKQMLGNLEELTGNYGTSSTYVGYTTSALAHYYYGRHPSAKEIKELKKRMAELQLLRVYKVVKSPAGGYMLREEPILRMLVEVPLPKIGRELLGRDIMSIAQSTAKESAYYLELAPLLSLKAGFTPMLAKSFETPTKLLAMRLKELLAMAANNSGRQIKNPMPLTKQQLVQKLAGDIKRYEEHPADLQADWERAVQECIAERYIKDQVLRSGAVIKAYEEKQNTKGETVCIFGLNRTYLKENNISASGGIMKKRGRPKKAAAATTTPPKRRRGRPRKTAQQSGKK